MPRFWRVQWEREMMGLKREVRDGGVFGKGENEGGKDDDTNQKDVECVLFMYIYPLPLSIIQQENRPNANPTPD